MQKYPIKYSKTGSKKAYERSHTVVEWTSAQRCRNCLAYKSVIVIHHINKLKGKTTQSSLDEDKICDKIQHAFMIKSLSEIRDTGDLSKHNKGNLQQAYSQY